MTFYEACRWLNGEDVFTGCCPYVDAPGTRSKPAVELYNNGRVIPCCKLVADDFLGAIFLKRDGSIAIWQFATDDGESESDRLVDAVPSSWNTQKRRNCWKQNVWYLDRGPWVITDWLKDNARLEP